jgi:subtilisin family serine protease
MSGNKGYNKEHNYTDFNGTSSSTPIVAGIAALMLSANPSLSEKEVRDIIKRTADKVGHVPYVQGHNHRMGFGRVNALNAVNAAIGVNSNYGQAEKSASFVKPTEEKANHLISSSMNIF